jgi:hypothetical protein
MSKIDITTPSTVLANGMLKTAAALNASLQTVTDNVGNSSTLQLSTTTTKVNSTLSVAERLNVENDSTVTTQASAVIQASTLNDSLIIAPSGTGALMLNIPDGLTSGGNARGQYAVDLQRIRGGATQIASGFASVIAGGEQNRNSGTDSSILGGIGNIISSNFGSVGGGSSNNVSSNYSTVSGGQSNTASTGTHATVGGGLSNTASGQYSTVIGGVSNTASGLACTVAGGSGANIASGARSGTFAGEGNTANSNSSSVLGSMYSTASGVQSMVLNSGSGNTASGANSMVINTGNASGTQSIAFNGGRTDIGLSISFNTNSRATLYNQFAISNGVNINGGSQSSQLIASKNDILTTGGTTVLSLDGTGVTGLIIPNTDYSVAGNRAWNVTIKTIAIVSVITGTATGVTVGDVYSENKYLLFKKVVGISSIVGTVDTNNIKSDASMNTSNIIITVGGLQQMAITFTAPTFLGGGSVTCKIVSKVELTEVAY